MTARPEERTYVNYLTEITIIIVLHKSVRVQKE